MNDTHEEGTVERSVDGSGASVLKLTGELDIASSESVRRVIEAVVAESPSRIIFDLSELQFMDSTGITLLLVAASGVESVQLRRPSAIIRRIIESSGLSGVLRIES